ncbi:MAG: hypothetical protein WC339_01970 [Candidatus Izemoplasmatales bacterium]|nr:hypothetical protein [Candidatus Izemoplasmatales bacterium]MDD4987636.1 hypothetical protein [Candidatus Izemoplasmatales bacterium]MDY0372862.1 hypothetical protein [Candidatus Izemoplasmatales bacterium]NLF49074.1 hypothetical protein [Acholeplasmataceae bacterium]
MMAFFSDTDFRFSLWFLITWPDIRNFLLGMATGFLLLALVVALFLVTNRHRKQKHFFSKSMPLDEKVVREMIQSKQTEMVETVKFTDNAYFKVAIDLSLDLMYDIARYYFPESKYPMYELSIQELLDLNYYITKRIETIVSGKIIRRFKNYRISTIINILQKKKAIDNSKLMKLSRKLKVSKFIMVGKAILNYANPIFWFRQLAIKPSVTLLTKEVCKMIIDIFGEETNKIYSKKLFQAPEDADKIAAEFDEIVERETNS